MTAVRMTGVIFISATSAQSSVAVTHNVSMNDYLALSKRDLSLNQATAALLMLTLVLHLLQGATNALLPLYVHLFLQRWHLSRTPFPLTIIVPMLPPVLSSSIRD